LCVVQIGSTRSVQYHVCQSCALCVLGSVEMNIAYVRILYLPSTTEGLLSRVVVHTYCDAP